MIRNLYIYILIALIVSSCGIPKEYSHRNIQVQEFYKVDSAVQVEGKKMLI